MKNRFFLIFGSLLLLSSCAKIYYSPDSQVLAKSHKTIAILPPTVSIAATKKMDANAIIEQQRTESLNFQKEMYSWMLRRKMQGKMFQEILDVETTNAKLKKAGYPETPLTPSEICDVLNVDGLLGSNFALSKPMSDGAAVALYLLAGAAASTNEVRVSLDINDCKNKKLIWHYNHNISGTLGSKPSTLVNQLMRHASRKMPYLIQY